MCTIFVFRKKEQLSNIINFVDIYVVFAWSRNRATQPATWKLSNATSHLETEEWQQPLWNWAMPPATLKLSNATSHFETEECYQPFWNWAMPPATSKLSTLRLSHMSCYDPRPLFPFLSAPCWSPWSQPCGRTDAGWSRSPPLQGQPLINHQQTILNSQQTILNPQQTILNHQQTLLNHK